MQKKKIVIIMKNGLNHGSYQEKKITATIKENHAGKQLND